MASLQHVLLQDWGVLGEVPPLLRLRTQSTSSPESWMTSSGRNPQWSPCQEQGAGARRKGWRCGQSGRTGGTATGGTTRCPGLQLRPCVHGSGHVLRVPCSVLPHLPQVGPSSPAGPGPTVSPLTGFTVRALSTLTGTHGLWPFPALSHRDLVRPSRSAPGIGGRSARAPPKMCPGLNAQYP